MDYFRYIKIHTWPRGLGKYDKRNVLFITEPQHDILCFKSKEQRAKSKEQSMNLIYRKWSIICDGGVSVQFDPQRR